MCLKIWVEQEREKKRGTERQRINFLSSGSLLQTYNGQDWARLKLGDQNLVRVFPVGCRDPSNSAITTVLLSIQPL